jgi:hypothetical protein
MAFFEHNPTQHNTTQHNPTQHNTTQHNTTQHNKPFHSAFHKMRAGAVVRVLRVALLV